MKRKGFVKWLLCGVGIACAAAGSASGRTVNGYENIRTGDCRTIVGVNSDYIITNL